MISKNLKKNLDFNQILHPSSFHNPTLCRLRLSPFLLPGTPPWTKLDPISLGHAENKGRKIIVFCRKSQVDPPDTGLQLRSIGLQLASPTDIKNWCFETDKKGHPIIGFVKNDKTINYKTLKPERGGLFCPKVFGKSEKKDLRYKSGYIPLAVPLAHIWYLKGSPSYLSILLRKKRRYVQNIIYGTTCVSFAHQPFNPEAQCLTRKNLNHLCISNDQFFNRKTSRFELKSFDVSKNRFYAFQSSYEMWLNSSLKTFLETQQSLFKQKQISAFEPTLEASFSEANKIDLNSELLTLKSWCLEKNLVKWDKFRKPKVQDSFRLTLRASKVSCWVGYQPTWTKFWLPRPIKQCFVQQINLKATGFIYIWEDRALFLEKLNKNLTNQLETTLNQLSENFTNIWMKHSKKFFQSFAFLSLQAQTFKEHLFQENLNQTTLPFFHRDLNASATEFYQRWYNGKRQHRNFFNTSVTGVSNVKHTKLKPFFQSHGDPTTLGVSLNLNFYYGFKSKNYNVQRFFLTVYLQRHFLKMIFFNSKLWKKKPLTLLGHATCSGSVKKIKLRQLKKVAPKFNKVKSVSKFHRVQERQNQRRRYQIYRRGFIKQQAKLTSASFRLVRDARIQMFHNLDPFYFYSLNVKLPHLNFSYCYPHSPRFSKFKWFNQPEKNQTQNFFSFGLSSKKWSKSDVGETSSLSQGNKPKHFKRKVLVKFTKNHSIKHLKSRLVKHGLEFQKLSLQNQCKTNSKTLTLQIKALKSKFLKPLTTLNGKQKLNETFRKPFFSGKPQELNSLNNTSKTELKLNWVHAYFSVVLFQYGIHQTLESNNDKFVSLSVNLTRAYKDKLPSGETFDFQKCSRYAVQNQLKIAQANWNACAFWLTDEEEVYEPLHRKCEDDVLESRLNDRIEKHIKRLKFYYDLPKRNKNALSFDLCYLPLSFGYASLPKPYLIQVLKLDCPHMETRWRNNCPDMKSRVNFQPKLLRNPLGHKNFRTFLKKTFNFSFKKTVLLSQLKLISKDLCSEKSFKYALDFKHNLNSNGQCSSGLNKNHRLKLLIQVEKDKLIHFILNQFSESKRDELRLTSNAQSKAKRRFKPWWLKQQQKVKLTLQTKFCGVCFNNSINFEKLIEQTFEDVFSQKNYFQNYCPTLLSLPLCDRPKSNQVLKNQQQHKLNLKSKLFKVSYDSTITRLQKHILELKRWKSDKFIFDWLYQKKRVLNTLISINCHKIDLFVGFLKPTYALQKSGLEKIVKFSSLFKQLPPRGLQSICGQVKRGYLKKRYSHFGLEPWLRCLNLKFNSSAVELTKNLNHYFSIKTKLIKAKTVRFLLLNCLFKTQALSKPDLVDFAWLLDLSKFSCNLMDYDKLLYRRCIFKSTREMKPHVQYTGLGLQNFLETQPVSLNRIYLVGQNFSWPLIEDFDLFLEFCNDQPRSNHSIVPAYVHQCITFETPRTGAWAIQTLLKKFKASLTLGSQLHKTLGEFANQRSVMPMYHAFLTNQLSAINNRVLYYQKAQEGLRLNLPKKLTNYFKENQASNTLGKHNVYFRQLYDRLEEKLTLKQMKLLRRFKLIRPFLEPQNDPAWLILNSVPVLPPDLRPVLTLDDGQLAVSDLNRLYQQLIQRNNRLDNFYTFDYIWEYPNPYIKFRKTLRMHYRLAQQAVDALIDNGKSDSKAVLNSRGQPLKSLAEVLRGKKGRFRQNLLGKRVDYSGRSVIIVGPQLKVHQCGLPKEMALELFHPFIIRDLIETKICRNFTRAKQWIRLRDPFLWVVVERVVKDHPILLNRAPTLHRLGIQAFQPKLVSGRAILLHPLVCSAFNADFDGDQMAVHVPLSYEACSEAWRLMWSCNSVFSPATGDPILTPTQDMVLGCYYLSTLDFIKHGNFLKARLLTRFKKSSKAPVFGTIDQVLQLLQLQKIQLHQSIWLRWYDGFELQKDQPCFELQLNPKGQTMVYYPDYYTFNDFNTVEHCNVWLKTTPGRTLINKVFIDLARSQTFKKHLKKSHL